MDGRHRRRSRGSHGIGFLRGRRGRRVRRGPAARPGTAGTRAAESYADSGEQLKAAADAEVAYVWSPEDWLVSCPLGLEPQHEAPGEKAS